MVAFRRLLVAGLLCWKVSAGAAELSLVEAWNRSDLRSSLTLRPGGELRLQVVSENPEPLSIGLPAGLICATANGKSSAVILVGTQLNLVKGAPAEARLPAALLSVEGAPGEVAMQPVQQTRPELQPLLTALAALPDLPRPTSQLAVLCVTENLALPKWRRFRGVEDRAETPLEIAEAIDALGILKAVYPGRRFALADDAELRARALRTPAVRGKAMQLYGLSLDPSEPPANVPTLGQLLHTKEGDNCPICRQRALLQRPASDF